MRRIKRAIAAIVMAMFQAERMAQLVHEGVIAIGADLWIGVIATGAIEPGIAAGAR